MAKTKITYNGIEKDYIGSKTLQTAGKVMATDMVIEPSAEVTATTVYPVAADTVIEPTTGYDGFSQVTLKSVTISGISAANIKDGVTVTVGDASNAGKFANVTGSFTHDATATSADILLNKTAYVKGAKVTGSIPTKTSDALSADGYTSEGTASITVQTPSYKSGDNVAVVVSLPAGYYADDVSKTVYIPNILPDVDPDATAPYIRNGYKAYSETGAQLVGTMVEGSTAPLTITNAAGSISVPKGYYDDAVVVSATPGTVTSSSATISRVTTAWSETNSRFEVSGNESIAAPAVSKTGYISSSVGTKTGSTAYVAASLPLIGVSVSNSAASLDPALSRVTKPATETWVDAANGNATGTKPTSGVYVGVSRAQASISVVPSVSVTSAGYGNADHFSHTETGANVSVSSATVYVPIKGGAYSVSAKAGATATGSAPAWNSTAGKFEVTSTASATANATATIDTAGWIAAGSTPASNTASSTTVTQMNKIAIQSSLANGTKQPSIGTVTMDSGLTNAASGAAVTTKPESGVFVKVKSASNTVTLTATATVTTAGYGTTATFTTTNATATAGASASADTWIPITTSTYTVAASASATITVGNPVYQSTGTNAGKFTVAGNATGYADATANIASAGWISSGSKSATQVTGATSTTLVLNKVGVTATVSGTLTQKPTIATNTVGTGVTNAASGAATTSAPSFGVYVAVKSAAKTGSITATGSVNAAGYGTTTQYTSGSANATVGADASDVTYVPITVKDLAAPTLDGAASTNASAVAPSIASGQAAGSVYRITATETQAAGWTSGTTTGTFDIPIYIEDFHA